jgi:hypothetical protein
VDFVHKKNTIIFFLLILFSLPIPLLAKIPDRPHGELPSDYWQFWFLYESEKRPGQDYKIFRPFFSNFSEYETAYSQQTVLFPVFYRERTNHWYTWSFLFFFTGTSSNHDDTGEDLDLISPLLLWGSGGTDNDGYIGFFPFYGKVKGKLSYQEINFFLFPLYADWSRRDYKARSILWPLVMWANTETRNDFRVLPFYSKKEHSGKYYQYSVLWPFFQWGRKFMDKKEPVSYGMFFPFYFYKDSDQGNLKTRGYLFLPFLGSLFSYGYDDVTTERDLNILFFLFQYGRNNSKDYRKLMFFPFYGQYQFASKKTLFITPLFFQLKTDSFHIKSEYNFLLPFFSHMTQYFPEQDRTDHYWKLWPFVRYHRDTEGTLEWNTITPFPMRSDELEKSWDPIFSLAEYKSQANGEKRLSFLFRFYTQIWSKDKFVVYIPLVTDFISNKKDMEWKFLYGFLGWKKTEEKFTIKLLWFIDI